MINDKAVNSSSLSSSPFGEVGRGSVFLSKPSRRHLGTISKECERIEIKKTIYNLVPVHCSPSAIVELRSLVLRRRGRIIRLCLLLQNIKSQISNFKYQCSNLNVQCSKFNIICVFVMINGLWGKFALLFKRKVIFLHWFI